MERDYFGLKFLDSHGVPQWLDPKKEIKKQTKATGGLHKFTFRIKFYSSEPNNLLEEVTRYQFFLQLKQDIFKGVLKGPEDAMVVLAAFILQGINSFNDFKISALKVP